MQTRRPVALEHLAPAWFVPAMGWAGLGLSWTRASHGLGEPAHLVSLLCAIVASIILAWVSLCMVWRWRTHPQALIAEIVENPLPMDRKREDVHRHDAYYPLLNEEQMTIDSIMMYDGEGTNGFDATANIFAHVQSEFIATIVTITEFGGFAGDS